MKPNVFEDHILTWLKHITLCLSEKYTCYKKVGINVVRYWRLKVLTVDMIVL